MRDVVAVAICEAGSFSSLSDEDFARIVLAPLVKEIRALGPNRPDQNHVRVTLHVRDYPSFWELPAPESEATA